MDSGAFLGSKFRHLHCYNSRTPSQRLQDPKLLQCIKYSREAGTVASSSTLETLIAEAKQIEDIGKFVRSLLLMKVKVPCEACKTSLCCS